MDTAAAAASPVHLPHLNPCPFLPAPPGPLTADCLAGIGGERGAEFYLTALLYSQSLWLQGHPARAVLLLNRAMGAALTGTEVVVARWPLPYKAAAWILRNRLTDQFIGNPRRHWQHLATRMVEPRRELRTWRAWACWRMACLLFPEMPGDEIQIARENVREPGEDDIAANLTRLGHRGEVILWREALDFCQSPPCAEIPDDDCRATSER